MTSNDLIVAEAVCILWKPRIGRIMLLEDAVIRPDKKPTGRLPSADRDRVVGEHGRWACRKYL